MSGVIDSTQTISNRSMGGPLPLRTRRSSKNCTSEQCPHTQRTRTCECMQTARAHEGTMSHANTTSSASRNLPKAVSTSHKHTLVPTPNNRWGVEIDLSGPLEKPTKCNRYVKTDVGFKKPKTNTSTGR